MANLMPSNLTLSLTVHSVTVGPGRNNHRPGDKGLSTKSLLIDGASREETTGDRDELYG